MIDNPDTRTLAQLAQEALDIQNACNLSGLVFGIANPKRPERSPQGDKEKEEKASRYVP